MCVCNLVSPASLQTIIAADFGSDDTYIAAFSLPVISTHHAAHRAALQFTYSATYWATVHASLR